MTIREFADSVRKALPYEANAQQSQLIDALARFCGGYSDIGSVFIVNGYAGTGKTSLTGALVKALTAAGRPVVLMAPTGRAAKVFSSHAGFPAYTIHRKIYRGPTGDLTAANRFLQHNTLNNAVFIVDEASMIGDGSGDADASNLLEDLTEYVFTPDNNRLILLGDVAQLPPVGSTESPAMMPASFKKLGLKVSRATLTDTVRQACGSGILRNATWLRRAMLLDPLPAPRLTTRGCSDIFVTDGNDVADVVGECYRTDGPGETIIVTRSNRRATAFNLGIRSRILDLEEELCKGERLLVAKNNYTWSSKVKDLDFIANGDVAIVTAIHATEERYGLRFAIVTLNLPDRDVDVKCRIFLDTLTDENASLPRERMQALAEARMADPEVNAPTDSYETRLRRLRKDEYFNALQVKYAYAVTCHKAQGAQWRNVIVDLGGIPPEAQGIDFYRWLYTAVSRATTRLFLLNPGDMEKP
ncbi:MAG: AAA family ATPase [Muribaculaceae bacterium]|nr:AAA family ATPase [Muribaculaceae bacterium]